eukprot:6900093-Lingulodinium_polyedra.AAC.1
MQRVPRGRFGWQRFGRRGGGAGWGQAPILGRPCRGCQMVCLIRIHSRQAFGFDPGRYLGGPG